MTYVGPRRGPCVRQSDCPRGCVRRATRVLGGWCCGVCATEWTDEAEWWALWRAGDLGAPDVGLRMRAAIEASVQRRMAQIGISPYTATMLREVTTSIAGRQVRTFGARA